MKSNWNEVKIDDICSIRRGASPRPIQKYISERGIPWVKIADATSSNSRFINETKEFIIEEGKEKSRYIEKGTLILSNSATPGLPKFMNINGCVHDGWLILDGFKGVYDNFLYYNLIENRIKLLSLSNGSVFRNLKTDIVKNFNIKLPPLEEQKSIAKILSDLDEKIEVNNKINKNLEEMAQAIFKQWFVDFEFPNEEGKPYKSSGGEMVESELGMIPKGFKISELKEIADDIITGKTPSTKNKENYGEKYPFITIPDMHNSIFINSSERYLSEKGSETQKSKLLPKNSIIVSCIATVGLVSITTKESHINQQINAVIIDKIEYLYYLYEAIKRKKELLLAIGSSGSATLNVNKKEFEKIKYLNPTNYYVNLFNSKVNILYEKIKANILENERLEKLRDTLLPKLMSGEIRVPLENNEN